MSSRCCRRVVFLLLVLVPGAICQRPEASALDALVRAVLAEHGQGVEAGIWVGPEQGNAWYRWRADRWRPAASSIKSAYLAELFASRAEALDEPLPGAAEVLAQDDHPALRPFTPKVRAEIRRELGGVSVRRLGRIMIRGDGVSNPVYNAAANVVTAVLGGPEELTRKIRSRDPAFSGFAARRYMLARRDVTGDNELTPDALGALLQRLAAGGLKGVEDATMEAIRATMLLEDRGEEGRHWFKSGSLSSHPQASILSGWRTDPSGTVVYVVMTTQPRPEKNADAAFERLGRTAQRLRKDLLARLRP